jgi:cellulose biosynthesis protein BcsQ
MIIGIYNKKGGVGKSPLSYLISVSLSYEILTNDDSDLVDKPFTTYQDKIDIGDRKDVVIDMGGWVDDNTADILKACDVVLVPFDTKSNSFKRTKNLIKELEELGVDYNLIYTQFENERDIRRMRAEFKDYEVDYLLPKTKMLDIMIKNDLTLKECLKDPTYKSYFKDSSLPFKELIYDLSNIE